jgi:hypothetical protein
MQIDHLVWVSPTLRQGCDELFHLSGLEAAFGGVHATGGSHNAIISLTARTYVEVLSIDPAQSVGATRDWLLPAQDRSGLATFAIASSDLDAVLDAALGAGLRVSPPGLYSRRTPEGQLLRWRGAQVSGHAFGAAMPFFIEWLGGCHPSDAGAAADLGDVVVKSPYPSDFTRAARALGIEHLFRVEPGTFNGVSASIRTPIRTVVLPPIEPELGELNFSHRPIGPDDPPGASMGGEQ